VGAAEIFTLKLGRWRGEGGRRLKASSVRRIVSAGGRPSQIEVIQPKPARECSIRKKLHNHQGEKRSRTRAVARANALSARLLSCGRLQSRTTASIG